MVVLLAMLVVGCSDKDTSVSTASSETKAPAEEAQKGYTFGYIAYDMTDIWNEYSANAFSYAAEQADVPVDVVILDSKNSLEQSITAMESLIQQGVDGISIFPISTEQGAQLVRMANDAGIPVTVENFAMEIDNPGDYIAAVACEYDAIGYAAIEYIAEVKPGAKIFYLAGQRGAGVYEKYQEGVDRAMEKHGDTVDIVATLHGDWATDKAYNVTTDLIASGEDFDYIFANNGLMAKGAYQALQDSDLGYPIVSTGGSPDDYDMLTQGVESANMTAPVSLQGIQTFKNLYDYVVLGTSPSETFQTLPVIPVGRDSLDEFIAWDDYAGAYDFIYNK